jgi:diguanylate cyclase (GGDEF)-like protein/PAS domain S-box-containing protein
MADFAARIARGLTVRYVAVLTVLGALSLASFLGVAGLATDMENGRELLAIHGTLLLGTIVVLVVSAFGVFQPMVQRIEHDVEERCRAEQDLRDSEARLWQMLEESPVGVSVSRRSDGQIVFANRRFTDILGMDKDEFIGSSARAHYVDDAQRAHVLQELRRAGRIDDAEVEFRRKSGLPFWSLLTLRSTRIGGEEVNLAWIYDITERKATEEKIRLAAKVLETASEGVVITNARNEIIFVNPAFSTITEYTAEEVLGQNPSILQSGRHDDDFYASMWQTLATTGRWHGEVWNRRKSGEFFAEWLSVTMIRDPSGTVTHYVAVFSDITHRKEDEERVWRQANYDSLTGLPNRSLFNDRLSQALRMGKRDEKKVALLFVDLDGFKQVNDTLGHAAGDVLLQQAGVRLMECMRASDTVARLAGDEFTAIVYDARDREASAVVAAKIVESMAKPFYLEEGAAQVYASVGVALYPADGEDETTLVAAADQAMYAVKRHGKNGWRFATTGEPDVPILPRP